MTVPRLRQTLIIGIAFGTAAMLFGGCAGRDSAAPASLDGSAWVLSTLPGHELLPGSPPTMRFEGDRIGGSDGCNRYGGTYHNGKAGAFRVAADLASTQMACPEPVMRQAAAFIAALQQATDARMAGAQLELVDARGAVLARLTVQPHTLAGTAWRVTAINNGRQAVSSVLAGARLTLAFDAHGRASGSAGCNRFSAGYSTSGQTISFTPPAATKRWCAEPEGVMAQEAAYLAALETAATARREDNRLDLRTRDGALAVSLTLEAPR